MQYISLFYGMSNTPSLVCVVIASLYYLVFSLEILEHGFFYVCFTSIIVRPQKQSQLLHCLQKQPLHYILLLMEERGLHKSYLCHVAQIPTGYVRF